MTPYLEIETEYQRLRVMRVADLRRLVQLAYRVVSLTDADKGTLVGMLLESRFGRRRLEAWSALRTETIPAGRAR